jgi:hypothetical protein
MLTVKFQFGINNTVLTEYTVQTRNIYKRVYQAVSAQHPDSMMKNAHCAELLGKLLHNNEVTHVFPNNQFIRIEIKAVNK